MKIKSILMSIIAIVFTVAIPFNASAFSYEYEEDDVVIDYLPGDVDLDGFLKANDARLCLRAAAKLEELTPEEQKVADTDCSGVVESSDARAILRASAKLETITVTVNLKVGQNLVVGPLTGPAGWEWWYLSDSVISDSFYVKKTYINPYPVDALGSAPHGYFTFQPKKNGEFLYKVRRGTNWEPQPDRAFDIIIYVK